MSKKIKIPIIRYLSYLLVVSLLFTGVTFSRYSMTTSGESTAHLARFQSSYEVDDISSTSIPNVNYWLNNGSVASTARTMRYTIKNSKNGIVSAVDVQGTLRIYLPAEMADHLALQLADQDAQSGTTRVCTPEIVLGELIYDENGNYRTYDNQTVDTSSFEDYYDNKTEGGHGQSVADEAMLVNGTLSTGSASRTLTAQSEGASGLTLSVSAQNKQTHYSLGFQRGKDENDYAPQLFLELQKAVDFYTVDITLPSMYLTAGQEQTRTYVLYFTLTERIGSEGLSGSWTDADNAMITTPPSGNGAYTYEGAEVLGYSFDQPAAYAGEETQTTVRVQCLYDGAGAYDVSLYHVAPISENSTASFVHPITFGGQSVLEGYDYGTALVFGTDTGTCSNTTGARDIDISALVGDPFAGDMHAYELLSKSYEVKFTALFAQASQSGGDV